MVFLGAQGRLAQYDDHFDSFCLGKVLDFFFERFLGPALGPIREQPICNHPLALGLSPFIITLGKLFAVHQIMVLRPLKLGWGALADPKVVLHFAYITRKYFWRNNDTLRFETVYVGLGQL